MWGIFDLLTKPWDRRSSTRAVRYPKSVFRLEPMESRVLPDVTASFDPATGVLTVLGDSLNNTIGISRDAAGTILVNGGAVPILGGTATVANTSLITASGLEGDDSISLDETNGALPSAHLFGGAGNDVLIGSQGNDLVTGGDGDDVAFLGLGNDTFVWNPGDDNDTIEGQGGTDTMVFNGANIAEIIDISANGGRVRFTRNIATVTMDLNDVEQIDFNALGGADTITANDLSGTDVVAVNLNLAGAGGGGDVAADVVIVTGPNGADSVQVLGSGANYSVAGLAAQVNVQNSEGANDQLILNTLAGNDAVSAATLPAGIVKLTLDGDAGNDQLTGSQGNDVLLGGADNDTLIGGDGDDQVFGGSGNDRMIWNPGDDTDLNEGGADIDTVEVN